jgi:hypothetical protein
MAAEKAWGIGMKRACVSWQGGGGAEGEVPAWRLKARRKLVKKRSTSTWNHSALLSAPYLTSRSLGLIWFDVYLMAWMVWYQVVGVPDGGKIYL